MAEAWIEQGTAAQVLAVLKEKRPLLAAGGFRGVGLVPGPGRFSAVRLGVLYAHLVARWFSVPLYEAVPDDAADDAGRAAYFAALAAGERSQVTYLPPVYDREPNITLPRV